MLQLTVGEKDLADLAFAGLSSYLKEKLEGHEFLGVNQVPQRAVMHENRTKDQRSYSRFRDSSHRERDKGNVNYLKEGSNRDGEGEGLTPRGISLYHAYSRDMVRARRMK
jgi:hypothetical protein